jgi:hypothetical protein
MMGMTVRRSLLVVLATLVVAGCTSKDPGPVPPSNTSTTFGAELASTDLISGTPQDVEIGLLHSDPQAGVQLVAFGTVTFQFGFLGSDPSSTPQPGPTSTASYLPSPETQQTGTGPALAGPEARGVYVAKDVTFDRPGLWTAAVSADVQNVGALNTSVTTFVVSKDHILPGPGDAVTGKLDVQNRVIGDPGVPASAIDSRALDGAPIPDPLLHRWTIRDAIAQHRPILVVFATPTYCISQFCGPTTDAVSTLEQQYADRAVFIHVEIYYSYNTNKQQGVFNKAAAAWLYRNQDLTEPWLYLIGSDGVIQHRWGPLFDPNEVAKDLAALPKMH